MPGPVCSVLLSNAPHCVFLPPSKCSFLGSCFCHPAGDIKIRAKLGVDFIHSTFCSVPVTNIYQRWRKEVCVGRKRSEQTSCLSSPVYTSLFRNFIPIFSSYKDRNQTPKDSSDSFVECFLLDLCVSFVIIKEITGLWDSRPSIL